MPHYPTRLPLAFAEGFPYLPKSFERSLPSLEHSGRRIDASADS
jgi:hypothetical protein